MRKFDPDKDYPVKKDLKHFEYFLKNQPVPKNIYVNKDGVKRLCVNVRYPEGAVTPQTSWRIIKKKFSDEEGKKFYHTPCASLIGQKESIVDYKEGENYEQCTSREWLSWLGEDGGVIKPPPPEVDPLTKQSPEVLARRFPVNDKEGDEISKGAKWTKPSRRGR